MSDLTRKPPASAPQPQRVGDIFFRQMAKAVVEELQYLEHCQQRLLDMEQTAAYLGLSEDAIRDLVSRGVLKPTRLTRKVQFDVMHLRRVLDEQQAS